MQQFNFYFEKVEKKYVETEFFSLNVDVYICFEYKDENKNYAQ